MPRTIIPPLERKVRQARRLMLWRIRESVRAERHPSDRPFFVRVGRIGIAYDKDGHRFFYDGRRFQKLLQEGNNKRRPVHAWDNEIESFKREIEAAARMDESVARFLEAHPFPY